MGWRVSLPLLCEAVLERWVPLDVWCEGPCVLPGGRESRFSVGVHGRLTHGGKTWEVFKMTPAGRVLSVGASGFGYVWKFSGHGHGNCPAHYGRPNKNTCRMFASEKGLAFHEVSSRQLHHGCLIGHGSVKFNHNSLSCPVCSCGRARPWPFSGCHISCGAKCGGTCCCLLAGVIAADMVLRMSTALCVPRPSTAMFKRDE